jgi:uncharacterized membrane-anchored protein YjiN (DUF445 family)
MTADLDLLESTIPKRDVVRLRRMKITATGFLAAAAVVYGLTFLASRGGVGLLGFVRAAGEAAMVGGLADWFAVTALFRRPLHLPIPHTAIIPQKKDEIATKLGTFVTSNFLTPELMSARLKDARVVARVGAWLREPVNAAALAGEVGHALSVALDALDEDSVLDYLLEVARRDLARRSYAPLLGQLFARAIDGDVQRPLVDIAATRARAYLRENREGLRPIVKDYLADQSFLAGLVATRARTDRLIDFAIRELDAIGRDPQHPLRRRIDDLLRSMAVDLETNGETAVRVDAAVQRLLDDERLKAPLRIFIAESAVSLRASLEDQAGGLGPRVAEWIQQLGVRVDTDAALEARLEAGLRRAVSHAIREYGDEFTVLIQQTVAGWNPTSAARRIEVAVGRDLQFIRINGTVVGALAGLAIHAVTVAA